eukprot:7668417-Pyramimonas_sp.AAC.1
MAMARTRPTFGRGAWNVLDYHRNKSNCAENVNSPTYEWDVRVTEFLQLYVDVTDPRLKAWTNNLSCQEKCRAMLRLPARMGTP